MKIDNNRIAIIAPAPPAIPAWAVYDAEKEVFLGTVKDEFDAIRFRTHLCQVAEAADTEYIDHHLITMVAERSCVRMTLSKYYQATAALEAVGPIDSTPAAIGSQEGPQQ